MTMFMTQMRLNPARQGTRRLLGSPQRMHAAVSSSFPELGNDRVLWRVDSSHSHDVRLLLVSPQEPDLTHLVEQAGWPTLGEATWLTKSYSPFLARLVADQTWSFRLRANPVRRQRDENGRIRTQAHVTVDQQRQWFLDRVDGLGVELLTNAGGRDSVEVVRRDAQQFQRRSAPADRGRHVTIASADFEGILRVRDAELLRQALVEGIGRAKAYGCGLMTLARAR